MNIWNLVAAALVFVLVYRSIRKIQLNAKNNNNGCSGDCSSCHSNCVSNVGMEELDKKTIEEFNINLNKKDEE